MPTHFVSLDPGDYLRVLSQLLLTGGRRFMIRGLTPSAVAFASLAQPLNAAFSFTLKGADRHFTEKWPEELLPRVPVDEKFRSLAESPALLLNRILDFHAIPRV